MMTSTTIHVLVIAHPDDESMFFLPTLQHLVEAKQRTVWILCLTNGNYDGLGKTREQELMQVGKWLGVEKTIILDNPLLRDHPMQRWDRVVVAAAIRTALVHHHRNIMMLQLVEQSSSTDFVLYTFDANGVSGHVNHIDTFWGVYQLMIQQRINQSNPPKIDNSETKKESIESTIYIREAWQLHSESNVVFKYLPVISWILVLASLLKQKSKKQSYSKSVMNEYYKKGTTTQVVYRLHRPRLNWKAMATHRSQFVWYRRLFVVFSSYTYYNKLTLLSRSSRNGQNSSLVILEPIKEQ